MSEFVDPFEQEGKWMPGEIVPVDDPAGLEEELPPEPPFLIHRNKFGPGVHGEYLPDGTPVGAWLNDTHPELTGQEVESLLIEMGMEEVFPGRAAWFGGLREGAIQARKELLANPAVEQLARDEAGHNERTRVVREAFLKRMKREGHA